MAQGNRIYVVKDAAGVEHLIRAISQPQALAHLIRTTHSARAAAPDDVARLMETGVTVQNAVSDPE